MKRINLEFVLFPTSRLLKTGSSVVYCSDGICIVQNMVSKRTKALAWRLGVVSSMVVHLAAHLTFVCSPRAPTRVGGKEALAIGRGIQTTARSIHQLYCSMDFRNIQPDQNFTPF